MIVIIIDIDCLLDWEMIAEQIFSQIELDYLKQGKGCVWLDLSLWLRYLLLLL